MFVEFPNNTNAWKYDYVIVGSGFAGLVLAEQLSKVGKVLVVEAGGLDKPRDADSAHFGFESSGRDGLFPGISRAAAFGGSSSLWAGISRPLSPMVFADRAGMPNWPISYEEYAHYLAAAEDYLDLAPHEQDDATPQTPYPLLMRHHDLRFMRFQRSTPIRQLANSTAVAKYQESDGIDVLLDTRVVDIHLEADGGSVASVDLLHRHSGKSQKLPIKTLLLCCGGIENSRLMCFAGRKYSRGNALSGGPKELTGKWFNEHPVIRPMELFVDDRIDLSAAAPAWASDRSERWFLSLSDQFLQQHQLPRFGVGLPDAGWWDQGPPLDGSEDRGCRHYWRTTPIFLFEQTPLPESRVSLSEDLDANGFPLARIHWKVAAKDLDGMSRAAQRFTEVISQRGVAHCRFIGDARSEDWSGLYMQTSKHHMGTTRMAQDAFSGVVDPQSRVFGLRNMYVAGSSVFPSGDWVNPTLSLTALAIRLAEHLQRLRRSEAHTVVFSSNNAQSEVLVSGWSSLEPEGVWSDGKRAELRIASCGARQLRLYGRGYDKTQVELSLNGKLAYSGPWGGLFNRTFPLSGGSDLHIVFALSQTASPKSLGENSDMRKLGLFLHGVQVR